MPSTTLWTHLPTLLPLNESVTIFTLLGRPFCLICQLNNLSCVFVIPYDIRYIGDLLAG